MIEVDYDSVELLTSAFNQQDVVVSTIGVFGVENEKTHTGAAIAVSVKRFISSESMPHSTHIEL